MSNYNQLKEVLNDIFELNKADLDFGIYRIMNQKRKQVNEFIDKQLPANIKQALSSTQSVDKTEIEKELKTLKKNLEDAGVVAEDSPKYKTLIEKLQTADNTEVLEQEVFSHLANFFRRYYKDGDFISMRRYKKDVYAIPYEGEEVKLHWANHDQYYIKSSENFKQYSFVLPNNKKVTFQLKEVSTEQNNNKLQGDAERRFAIYTNLPVEEVNDELFINFMYEPFPKSAKQETLLAEALEILTQKTPVAFSAIFTKAPTEKNKERTLVEKHLADYVAKNSFDYFIHKDLGGFLSRELDFYIKNEVLYIDDINVQQTDFFVAQLSKVKAIKAVAQKIIDFLAQIENFQKKLWLKKKFVISTHYCITLDKIPSTYYAEIVQNQAQLQAWKTLFNVAITDVAQLAFEPYLQVDTQFFDETFKDRLLAEFDNLDEQTDGVLINSENFQAINMLQEKYTNCINVTYIDPPYNTDATPILYKNEYRESTWLSLIFDRLQLSLNLFNNESGALSIAIDDAEIDVLKRLIKQTLRNYEIHKVIVNHYPGSGTGRSNVSRTHEYNLFAIPIDSDLLRGNLKKDGVRERNFRRAGTGSNNYRIGRPNSFFAILIDSNKLEIVGAEPPPAIGSNYPLENTLNGLKRVYPFGSDGSERVWSLSYEGALKAISEKNLFCTPNYTINRLYNDEGARDLVQSLWTSSKFNATVNGTNLLTDLFNNSGLFSYPKSVYTVKTAIDVISHTNYECLILDYFAGSGTTGHATIKLNREDGGNRKYILVEMGTYFNTVTKPRIQKVIYSDNWKNGQPQDKAGISQIVKYQVLESYEDTLNNLYLQSPLTQAELALSQKAKEEYLLQYMLEIESRDHLFNLEMFRKPFNYQLKVTQNNELQTAKVDLVETFNYLIGLYVSKVQRVKDIKVVEGTTRTGIKTLVIWRDVETTTHEEVEKLIRRFYDSERTKTFQQIYINGDHHLENLRTEGDSFKIKLIEETFFKKMFNEIEL